MPEARGEEIDPGIDGLRGEGRDLGRLVSLSDGVFAFAMTLLVVTLVLPTVAATQGSDLGNYLGKLLPGIAGYALSFFVIGSYWLQHQRLFAVLRRYDHRLLALNMVFLFFVSITPFLLAVVLTFGPHSFLDTALSAKLAIAIYGAFQIVAGLTFYALVRHATDGRRLVDARLPDQSIRLLYRSAFGRIGVMLVSIAVAAVLPTAAEFVWIGVALDQRRILRSAARGPPSAPPAE